MRESALHLLFIDADPIFRLGFRTACEAFADVRVVGEASGIAEARSLLATLERVDVAIIELAGEIGLSGCQELRSHSPQLPLFLLTAVHDPQVLTAAKAMGIRGYSSKGTDISILLQRVRQVALGAVSWAEIPGQFPENTVNSVNPRGGIRTRWRLGGLRQIQASITQVREELQNPALSDLDRAVLAGRLRELRAARWLVDRLLTPTTTRPEGSPTRREAGSFQSQPDQSQPLINPDLALVQLPKTGLAQPASLFETLSAQLQFSLQNLTSVPLEIDILREDKRRELLTVVLRQIEFLLQELHNGELGIEQLIEKKSAILMDLWSASLINFFGRYYQVVDGDRLVEVVPILLKEASRVQQEVLNKIPLVIDLFTHFLYQTPLLIDNVLYSVDTPEARIRVQEIIQNLMIQVANAVMQPLLNYFSDLREIKQDFYKRDLITTREIERFRNDLSWKYRQREWWFEPKAIFESQYQLMVLDSRGIKSVAIYAPRRRELEQLRGEQYLVTLFLELRDAIAPRMRSLVRFIGSGMVYILTQIIGRAIGLVGKGILQGVGNSISDPKFNKQNIRDSFRE